MPAYFDDLRVYAIGGSGGAPSGDEIRYRYSAEGQRTYTQVGTGAPTFTVRDGAAALGQLRGPASSGGDPTVDYWNVVLPSGTPIGRMVPSGRSVERRYYHTDHLGSTRAVTDGSGQVVERRDHYPFGLQMPGRSLTQGVQTDEDYTGHELDEETGMHYAGARYYMSALGRWGVPDPLADKYPALSPFAYVANTPVNAIDPDGRDIWFVHGTFSDNRTWDGAMGLWERALNDQRYSDDAFNWPTTRKLFQNTRRARWQAAQKLARQITEAAENDPGMLIQIVAHSHGGNVAIMAANILESRDITVDRLVLLGTPHRSYYELNSPDAVGELVNAYSRKDGIQELGSRSYFDIAMGYIDTADPKRRPDREGAVNVDVTVQSDDKVSHTTLHTREEVINFLRNHMN